MAASTPPDRKAFPRIAPFAVVLGGLLLLAALPFLAGPGAAQVAAFVPPWQHGGMARAAALGLPVLDIRWGGHLLLLDPSPQDGALARLRGQGLLLLDASRLRLCPPAPAVQNF